MPPCSAPGSYAARYLGIGLGGEPEPTRTPARTARRGQLVSADESPKAVIAALLANLGIAVTKVVAFALTGAASMLAEAIHSFADCGNQGLLLLGGRRARRAPTEEHPFGFGRERYVYAFIVSIVLFSVGGLFALYEAYHKFHEVHSRTPERPARRAAGGGCRCSCWCSRSGWRACRCGRRSRSRTVTRGTSAGSSSSGGPSRRSCRWCSWRTSRR